MTAKPRSSPTPEQTPTRPSAGLLFLSWLFVAIPLAWGVFQTIIKSMALFH